MAPNLFRLEPIEVQKSSLSCRLRMPSGRRRRGDGEVTIGRITEQNEQRCEHRRYRRHCLNNNAPLVLFVMLGRMAPSDTWYPIDSFDSFVLTSPNQELDPALGRNDVSSTSKIKKRGKRFTQLSRKGALKGFCPSSVIRHPQPRRAKSRGAKSFLAEPRRPRTGWRIM